jgi:hypothetical protein
VQGVVHEGLSVDTRVPGDAGEAAAVGRDVAGAVKGLAEGARRAEEMLVGRFGGVMTKGLGVDEGKLCVASRPSSR